MGSSAFDLFERFIVCITPIALGFIGVQQTRSEKKSKEFLDLQKQLDEARREKDERDKLELQEHFQKLENSIETMSRKISEMENTVNNITKLNKQITGLIQLSSANLQLCQSLSNIVSSIGDALDSTDSISSGDLKVQLLNHRKKEQEVTEEILKIMY